VNAVSPYDPKSEFDALGADEVRRRVLLGRWPSDELSAARAWLERRESYG